MDEFQLTGLDTGSTALQLSLVQPPCSRTTVTVRPFLRNTFLTTCLLFVDAFIPSNLKTEDRTFSGFSILTHDSTYALASVEVMELLRHGLFLTLVSHDVFPPPRMHVQKQWACVAVVAALLILTVSAAEGGKAEKQGEILAH